MSLKKDIFYLILFNFRYIFLFNFGNLFNSTFSVYNKQYFFICIKLWIDSLNINSISYYTISLILNKNYNLIRFLEYSRLSNFFITKFKSSFFSFNKHKLLIPFNVFKLKININLFFLTNNYLNFFRRFKYREYLKKVNKVQFIPVSFSSSSSFYDNYLFNLTRNNYLVFSSSSNSFNNLQNISGSFPYLDLSFYSYNNLNNKKYIFYLFKLLKQFLRIYFLIWTYNLFFHFKKQMRSYCSVRIISLLSLHSLNKRFPIDMYNLFFKLLFLNSFLENTSASSYKFSSFLSLDILFIKPMRQYFLIDYFSNLYYSMYFFIKSKFKNNKRRKLSLWRKAFVIFFRVFMNFNNIDFIDIDSSLFMRNLKFSLDFLTWSIFNSSLTSSTWCEFQLVCNTNNINTLLNVFCNYTFNISFLSFIQFYDINNNYIYFFLIKFFKDSIFKYMYLINYELNKKVIINNFYPILFFKNKEYKYNYSRYLYYTKVLKFDKYYKSNFNFYIE